MIVTLQTQRVQTLEQVRRVAEGNEPVDFALAERASAYEFIGRTLVQFDYAALGKADKGAVKAYLGKMTGLSRAQLTRIERQGADAWSIRERNSSSVIPTIRSRFVREVSPRIKRTRCLAIPSALATSRSSRALAFPRSGGAPT